MQRLSHRRSTWGEGNRSRETNRVYQICLDCSVRESKGFFYVDDIGDAAVDELDDTDDDENDDCDDDDDDDDDVDDDDDDDPILGQGPSITYLFSNLRR